MNRAGQYITALSGIAAYKAYKPNALPPEPPLEMDVEMVGLLSEAQYGLGKLDAVSETVPNIDLFLGSYVRKEALLSSQIEGIQATLEDVLDAETKRSANLEVNDVINYVNALNYAMKEMKALSVCNRLLCETHKILMQGVRGQEKNLGEFRNSQNWIGAANSTIQTARYVPPTVEDMTEAMSDLEKFINMSEMNALLKTALVHYQFETIHPFLDGNGRIGRMLITLMLLNEEIIHRPVLYLSLFLKTNRVEYYDRLSEVRNKGNYEQWIKLFLSGVIETCKDSVEAILKINGIISKDEKKIMKETSAVRKIYDYLKEHPIVNISATAKAVGLSYNTVSAAIKKLRSVGIVTERTTKARNRVFEYSEYLTILKAGT